MSVPIPKGLQKTHFLLVVDGDCAMCARAAKFIHARDKKQQFYFTPIQGKTGQKFAALQGMNPADPSSWMLVSWAPEFRIYTDFHAVFQVLLLLGGIYYPMGWLGQTLLPAGLKRWLYQRIAKNRTFFGKKSFCENPSPSLKRQIIE